MQIVVDIADVTYSEIKKGKIYTSFRDVPQESINAIKNGTPLPKNHGRLIDADAFVVYCRNQKSRTVDCNDIARFPTTVPTVLEAESDE